MVVPTVDSRVLIEVLGFCPAAATSKNADRKSKTPPNPRKRHDTPKKIATTRRVRRALLFEISKILENPEVKRALKDELEGGLGREIQRKFDHLKKFWTMIESQLSVTRARVLETVDDLKSKIDEVNDACFDVIAALETIQFVDEVDQLNTELELLPVEFEEGNFVSTANDELFDIDPFEFGGWKGAYRLYVARQIQINDVYSVNSLPMAPRQWLEKLATGRYDEPILDSKPIPIDIEELVDSIENNSESEKARLRNRIEQVLEFMKNDDKLLAVKQF